MVRLLVPVLLFAFSACLSVWFVHAWIVSLLGVITQNKRTQWKIQLSILATLTKYCIHWFTYLHAALWRILTFAWLQNSWNRTFLNVFPFPSFLPYDGYSLLYDYKTRGICLASTRTSNMRRLRSVWLISTFGENYYVFIYLVNLKKNYLWWEQTYKRRAIAPAYFACPFSLVTSVKEAASSKSPEESQFFKDDNSRAGYIGHGKVHTILSLTPYSNACIDS